MPLCVSIIADDLTGALDACAPFASRGISSCVAVDPSGVSAALSHRPDVLCVNTASREVGVDEARARVRKVAGRLFLVGTRIAFKKVDSRLKGHVAAEVEAALSAFRRSRSIVLPAVPEQGRLVRDGKVIGRGVTRPIPIAGAMGLGALFSAPDVSGQNDFSMQLERIAFREDVLFVGASGLAIALAEEMNPKTVVPPIALPAPLLVVVGSYDPITLEQVACAADLPMEHHISRDGYLRDLNFSPAGLIVQAIPDPTFDVALVMDRFAESIVRKVRAGLATCLLVTGGETAQTLFRHLGIACVNVLGEALPGIPAMTATIDGKTVTILTKSGGFGRTGDIRLLARGAGSPPGA